MAFSHFLRDEDIAYGLDMINLKKFNLPGHAWVLQGFVSKADPRALQSFPPCAGLGLSHDLWRVCSPPPHSSLHSSKSDHLE